MKHAALISLAALSLVGCMTPSLPLTPAQQAQVYLARGQLGADSAYNIAAHAFLALPADFDPAAKATIQGFLHKVYVCHPPVVDDTQCAGYLKDLHDAVTDGNDVAQGNLSKLITDALAQAYKAGLPVSQPHS